MIEIKAEHGDKKLEIKLEESNENIQAKLISSVMSFLFTDERELEIETKTTTEDQYKQGYEALKTDKEGLHHPKSEFEEVHKINKSQKLGLKEIDGEKRYQTFYRCPQCNNTGKHFLTKARVYCTCHECGKRMRVREAAVNGFPNQDEFGNYYIAGDFKRSMHDKEEDDKFDKRSVV